MTRPPGILLDTTVLIDILRRRNGRPELLRTLLLSGAPLHCSAINQAEVYGGLRSGEQAATGSLFDALHVIPLTAELAQAAGQLRSALRSKGITRSLPDTIVAATALQFGLLVATDNRRDFQLEGLKLLALP